MTQSFDVNKIHFLSPPPGNEFLPIVELDEFIWDMCGIK